MDRVVPIVRAAHAKGVGVNLRANPTKRENASRKRLPLRTPEEQAAWLRRKAEQAGFDVDETSLQIAPAGREWFRVEKRGQAGVHHAVEFAGVLHVKDPARFREAFAKGVGSAKGFGFGLLALVPVAAGALGVARGTGQQQVDSLPLADTVGWLGRAGASQQEWDLGVSMQSNMDWKQHHQGVQRALALGRSNDPAALPELVGMLKLPSTEIRRLAASAIGKLSGFGADPATAVKALAPVATKDPHPQVRQYALKAMKAYGAAAEPYLHDLRDASNNPAAKDYVRTAAASAAAVIEESVRIRDGQAQHACFRCAKPVAADEYARSQKAFQYLEYWGMEDNLDYRIGMMEKMKLYQQAGKKLVSLHAHEKPRLREALREKLGRHMRLPPDPPAAMPDRGHVE